MKQKALLLLAASLALADDPKGIRPRGSSGDYPAHQSVGGVTAAAALVSPDEVNKIFATDLNAGGYIVVEVAIYPQDGKEAEITSGDFQLRIGPDTAAIRAVSARAIAAALQRKSNPNPQAGHRNDINIYPTATIGYETGRDPYGRRRGGVYIDVAIGVGVDNDPGASAPPSSRDEDRSAMEQELTDKGLPEGRTTQAVAGYLYFPKPARKQSKAAAELTWYGSDRVVHLKIPAARRNK